MWHPILMINGFIMLLLGIIMMIPAEIPYYFGEKVDYCFIESGLIAIFFGGALFLSNYGKIDKISVLQGYIITISCWFMAPLVCALPFVFYDGINGFYNAVFEAAAGITTTSATILSDVEIQPKSILLWRAILNGLGGIGIIIFAVALAPFLGTGGMHLFSKENSDTEEKFLPKISYIANDIIIVYVLLNLICAVLLHTFGMDWFDAICWTMSTLSTGGFSIKNSSIAFYDSATIEFIIALFMLLGAFPITYFVLLSKKRNLTAFIDNYQVNAFVKLILLYSIMLSLYYAFINHVSLLEAFRIMYFSVISAVTTSGIFALDYTTWGGWTTIVFLILFLHGGCTGSTSSSIKIFRWQVVSSFLNKHMKQALSPNQVVVMKAGDKVIDDNIVASVFALVLSFLFAILFFTLVISLTGVDFMTSFSAVIATITGVGTGFTEELGPRGNFDFFSPLIKYILSFIMVLGRLEVITVFVLLFKIRLH